jgi:anthranilate/para-aminobenzoate synthase component II
MEENIINSTKGGDILIGLRVLLIDNGSDTLNDYLTLLNKHKVKTISFRDIATCDFRNYQLIVLSDGHSLSVSKNIDEINLVRHISAPVIGICYGFQVLCFAYGAKLVELPEKREGLVKVVPEVEYPIFQDKKDFIVSEKHRFAVQNIPATLSCLARSKYGCEIVQVKGKQQFGFQFHPENNNTQNEGREIMDNLIRFIFDI